VFCAEAIPIVAINANNDKINFFFMTKIFNVYIGL